MRSYTVAFIIWGRVGSFVDEDGDAVRVEARDRVRVACTTHDHQLWLRGIGVLLHPVVSIRKDLAERSGRDALLDLDNHRLLPPPCKEVDAFLAVEPRLT